MYFTSYQSGKKSWKIFFENVDFSSKTTKSSGVIPGGIQKFLAPKTTLDMLQMRFKPFLGIKTYLEADKKWTLRGSNPRPLDCKCKKKLVEIENVFQTSSRFYLSKFLFNVSEIWQVRKKSYDPPSTTRRRISSLEHNGFFFNNPKTRFFPRRTNWVCGRVADLLNAWRWLMIPKAYSVGEI